MYYEINVAKAQTANGKIIGYGHLFATAKRSCTSEQRVKQVLKEIVERFPEPWYEITVTYYEELGQGCNITELLTEK